MTEDQNLRDDDRFGQRVKRYARVTGTVGSLASRLAVSRVFGMDLSSGRHAEDLKKALGGLKGPLMKVAQILATIPDALPQEYAQELSQLQANAPAMGWLFVKRRMATELGRDWQSKFQSFEKQAIAAASLGQVHRAVAPDGQRVACKLQYPDMSAAVEADLTQLGVLFSIYKRAGGSIDPSNIRIEITDRLREELDYQLEAKHMQLYRYMLAGHADVQVPEPIADLSTERLLTMRWLEGQPIMDFKSADQDTRNTLAKKLFQTWYEPLFEYAVIHGDPHFGNYTVSQDGKINLLDFGCIRMFKPRFIAGVLDLYQATRDKDIDKAVHAYETWGFDNLTTEVVETLNIWAAFLFDAWIDDRVRSLQGGPKVTGVYGRETAEKVFKQLRELGGVTPPREFVFMDRAALGMGSVFLRLDAQLNWHQLMEEMMEGFDVDKLATRQAKALSQCGLGENV